MYPIITQCPVCDGEMLATRLKCRRCDSTIEGVFTLGPLVRLTPEQWAFIETFVRCEGKINRVEEVLNISYPTVRARLDDVILALGYQPDPDEPYEFDDPALRASQEERRQILDDLSAGRISSQEAISRLNSAKDERDDG